MGFVEPTTLYRPVGQAELELIAAADWSAFPPRLPGQPIFYPVLNEEYAVQIARDWNTKDERSGYVGYVLRFSVRPEFLERYEVQRVGGKLHDEYWIPAEELDDLNSAIAGPIHVIDAFAADDEGAPAPAFRLVEYDHDGVWEAVEQRFAFAPSINPDDWPVWRLQRPVTVYSFEWPDQNAARNDISRDLDRAAMRAMSKVLPPGESFISLDWQHETFEVWPHMIPKVGVDLPTPILPNGDYYLHLHRSLDLGFLGQPWEQTVTVMGEQLIDAFDAPGFLRRIGA